jgi:hypothetical protein
VAVELFSEGENALFQDSLDAGGEITAAGVFGAFGDRAAWRSGRAEEINEALAVESARVVLEAEVL